MYIWAAVACGDSDNALHDGYLIPLLRPHIQGDEARLILMQHVVQGQEKEEKNMFGELSSTNVQMLHIHAQSLFVPYGGACGAKNRIALASDCFLLLK